jgi:hypothetical protein
MHSAWGTRTTEPQPCLAFSPPIVSFRRLWMSNRLSRPVSYRNNFVTQAEVGYFGEARVHGQSAGHDTNPTSKAGQRRDSQQRSEAAISDPMKPPPITTKSDPQLAASQVRLKSATPRK